MANGLKLIDEMNTRLANTPVIHLEFRDHVMLASADECRELLACPRTPDYVRMWANDRIRQLS